MAGDGGGEATLPPLESALSLEKGHREEERLEFEQLYSFWLSHATQSIFDSPLRPKVEGLCCHCGAECVLEIRGDEQGWGDLEFTLQTPVEAEGHRA